jgi:hypothetical protein
MTMHQVYLHNWPLQFPLHFIDDAVLHDRLHDGFVESPQQSIPTFTVPSHKACHHSSGHRRGRCPGGAAVVEHAEW